MTVNNTTEHRTLYLVRHGERLDAVNRNWFCKDDKNKYDPPLSEKGQWQAQRLGERLRQEPIDYIFVSPYLRAMQTAQPIAEALDIPFYVDEGVGEWLGRSMLPKEPQIPPPIKRAADFDYLGLTHEAQVIPVYPETVQQVFERLQRAIDCLLEKYEGNLLIIAHGRVVTGIAHVLTGKPETQFQYDVACITKLALEDGEWQLRLNGDTSHLTEETMPHFV
jgi:broad specificity phosphatase PhoE